MKYIKSLTTGAITALALSIVFFSSTEALARWGDNQSWHMGPGMMGGWGMGWFGGIFMIIFWIIVLMALVYFVKWLIHSTGRGRTDVAGGSRALEILQERYARGEIDKANFETMKMDLSN